MPDDVVVTDSATAAEAAPAASGEAVEQTDATHGDTTDQATSTDDTAAEASTEADEDEGEESLPETATEEEKTRAQKRRERRQAREQERIDKAVQERYEQAERVREAKAAEEKTRAEADKLEQEYQQRFERRLGKPNEAVQLQQEINGLLSQTIGVDWQEATAEELDRGKTANDQIAAKRARIDEISKGREDMADLNDLHFLQVQGLYHQRAESLPESHRKAYLESRDIDTVLTRLEAGIVAREAAKHQSDKAAAVKAVTAELEKERAAHAATRTSAPGGGSAMATGGTSSGGSGDLTMERYRSMTTEQRRALTPAAIDAMMARHQADRRRFG